jgi:ribosomal-protein-alanine N-acetyltransferase
MLASALLHGSVWGSYSRRFCMRSEGDSELSWYIRAAVWRDLPQILSIEEVSHPDPWGPMAFESEITGSSHSCFWAAVSPGPWPRNVLGYVCFRWLVDEIYVINLTVAPDARGNGVGSGMLAGVVEWGLRKGAEKAVLEVGGDNERALRLYRKFGFRPACSRISLGFPVVMVLPLKAQDLSPFGFATQSI